MKRAKIPVPLTIAFLVIETAIYLAFLTLDVLDRGGETIWLKYGGIVLCLAFAFLCAFRGGSRLVAPALLFTAGADWFLLVRNNHLLFGVILFLCVQGLYFLRLIRAGGYRKLLWLRLVLAAILTSAPLLIPGMNTPLNLLAMFYFSQLLSNAIHAWTLPSMRTFALGLTLFVGCDICVGLFNAFTLSFTVFSVVSIGMWFFYLPSQVLIALSAHPKGGDLQ